MPPSFGAALGLSLRALFREAWLVAAGVLVAGLRRALTWPAVAVLWGLLVQAAFLAARDRPLDPLAPVQGALDALGSPRLLAIVGGLWVAGALVGGALRVAWVAGAVPVLGGAMAEAPGGTDRFAEGLAYGFPRVLAAAALALVVEVSGGLFAAALVLGAARLGTGAPAVAPALLAGAIALALVLAIAVPVALSAAADAAVARAALRQEGPAESFAGATRRFLARPGTFVLAALVFGAAGLLAPASIRAFGNVATGFARGARPLLLVGPSLMMGLLALVVAAVLDLAWIGMISALACAEDRPRS
jgi:hypothetical protein